MPVARNPNAPQINADLMLYGSIPIELFPNGTADMQIPLWVASTGQWYLARIVANGSAELNWNASSQTLEIVFNDDDKVYGDFTADAITKATLAVTFTADSITKGTLSATFTADAVLQ